MKQKIETERRKNLDEEILFWTAFAAIGQVIGAIATALAVIITLWG